MDHVFWIGSLSWFWFVLTGLITAEEGNYDYYNRLSDIVLLLLSCGAVS